MQRPVGMFAKFNGAKGKKAFMETHRFVGDEQIFVHQQHAEVFLLCAARCHTIRNFLRKEEKIKQIKTNKKKDTEKEIKTSAAACVEDPCKNRSIINYKNTRPEYNT